MLKEQGVSCKGSSVSGHFSSSMFQLTLLILVWKRQLKVDPKIPLRKWLKNIALWMTLILIFSHVLWYQIVWHETWNKNDKCRICWCLHIIFDSGESWRIFSLCTLTLFPNNGTFHTPNILSFIIFLQHRFFFWLLWIACVLLDKLTKGTVR